MYTDYVLFGIAIVCAAAAALLAVYIVVSRKRSRLYRKMLSEETVTMSAYADTLRGIRTQRQTARNETTATLLQQTETAAASDNDDTSDATVTLHVSGTASADEEANKNGAFGHPELREKYAIEERLPGGGMSRIFRAKHRKLGNDWIIKQIDKRRVRLANEEHILKQLNHIHLPQIIDIYEDEHSLYIVQRYIDGIPMNQVLDAGQPPGQSIIADWAEQLGQVLSYLHRLDQPIVHCDLKPSNIMVTHDNKLVLIDFGISRQAGENPMQAGGVTYRYAAPEQLKHPVQADYAKLIADRFGELPPERMTWPTDPRTDIFSLGVMLFELATGDIPKTGNRTRLREAVSGELAAVIERCLEIRPDRRYDSIDHFMKDIQRIKQSKMTMARSLFVRRLAAALLGVFVVASCSTATVGAYIFNQENGAILAWDSDKIVLSEQQMSELTIRKRMSNGQEQVLDMDDIEWSYSPNGIARVEGRRIVGMNEGETELRGTYRNKTVSLDVQVTKPMNGMVDISLRYVKSAEVSTWAGTGEREWADGAYLSSSFVSPEAIALGGDGTLAVADSGKLRMLRDGEAATVALEPEYITADIVRYFHNDLYMLTHEWEDEDGRFYAIIRLNEIGAEGVYVAEANQLSITDFDIAPDGNLYFIEQNMGVQETYLARLRPDTGNIEVVQRLDPAAAALTVDADGTIYVAYPEKGVIMRWDEGGGRMQYVAGVENERHFIDGEVPLFYEPRKLRSVPGYLYVLDFNTLRRIAVVNGTAVYADTIAGDVTVDLNPPLQNGAGSDAVFAPSTQMEFVLLPNEGAAAAHGGDAGEQVLLVTDPKHSVIRQVRVGGTDGSPAM